MTKIAGSASGSGSESISQRHGSGDPDPDPHQNFMDPQHWRLHEIFYILSQTMLDKEIVYAEYICDTVRTVTYMVLSFYDGFLCFSPHLG
jgi:hypothetical protein